MVDWLTKKLSVSVSKRVINKNEGGNASDLTDSFEPDQLTADELATSIAGGFAYCVQLKGKRSSANFKCSDIASVDIDGTLSPEDAGHHDLVQEGATIVYTTCSHTPVVPRFRMIFALERTITDGAEMRAITRSLALRLNGDGAVVDPSRLFYGNTKALIKTFERGLSNLRIDELIEQSLNNVKPAENPQGYLTSSRSQLTLAGGQPVHTADGRFVPLDSLPKSTPVYCPHHFDKNPSAFVTTSQSGQNGIRCSACCTTFWPKTEEPDFKTFDRALHKALDFSVAHGASAAFEMLDRWSENDYRNLIPAADIIPTMKQAEIKFLTSKYLPHEVRFKRGITYIKSPKGSGKTELLSNVLKEVRGKVLLVGHRQALIRNLCRRLDLNCYLDEEPGENRITRQQRYGVCLDSISKIDPAAKYDYLIIDESEQVLSHFLSQTMADKRKQAMAVLRRLTENAKHVVALDADLGWTSFRFFSSCKKADAPHNGTTVYINEFVEPRGTLRMVKSKKQLTGELHRALAANERCFVTANSKSFVDKVHTALVKEFGPDGIYKVTSENSKSEEVQTLINDIQTAARGCRAIVTSPSLSTGIDISFENGEQVFDHVFGMFESNVLTHFECDQQLSRVRHPKNTTVYINPQTFFFETDLDVVRRDQLMGRLLESLFLGFDRSGKHRFEENHPLLDLACSVETVARASKNNLKKHFIELKESQGWTIEAVGSDAETTSVGGVLLDLGKQLDDEQYRQRLLNAKRIPKSEVMKIWKRAHSNDDVNDDDRADADRTAIEEFYRRDISVEIIDLDRRGAFRKEIRMLRLLQQPGLLAARDIGIGDIGARREDAVIVDEHQRSKYLAEILRSANVFRDSDLMVDCLIEKTSLAEFVAYVQARKAIFENYFGRAMRTDLSKSPMNQLNFFLSFIGHKLIIDSKKKRRDGGKTYFYKFDPVRVAQSKEVLNRQKSIRNGWEFLGIDDGEGQDDQEDNDYSLAA
jgi:hypothetical protein